MEKTGNTETINNSGLDMKRLSRSEAAGYCGVSVVTIDRALAGKKISCFRIGRRVIFSLGHLDEFLSRNECKAKIYARNKGKAEWFPGNQDMGVAE